MNPTTSSHCRGRHPPDAQMDDWLVLSCEFAWPQLLDESREVQEAEHRGLKSKLVSVWNSVKYGWSLKQKSKFSKSSPVIILGQSYDLKSQEKSELFRRSYVSLLWLTYRRGFPQLEGGALTTDSGWGCVLRTGQMLLAKGLFLHLMPPDWTWPVSHRAVRDDLDPLVIHAADGRENGPTSKRGRRRSLDSCLDRSTEASHRRVASWFADRPGAPFGIHSLVELGKSSGKKAGDWYGPSIAAHILRKAVAASAVLPNLVVYVAQDCTIYLDDVKTLCERPPPQSWKSLIILVPVRLGGQDLNPSYIACVKRLLSLQCCIGIIGGKPKHSLYFIGFQDDHLLYLDPHYCQPTVDMTKENFPLESFHCNHPRKMPFSRMDPSCTIGFYAKGQKDFESLRTIVHEALSTSAETYLMFIFAEGKIQMDEESSAPTDSVAYIQRKTGRRSRDTTNSLEEFVLL
ncbi:cysteine protease atg4da-like [Brachionichthys hirsutus]|uniref:cysteine protease atg4da-like n=1 Tax=Brachionichthys hirsutus TaxID=412623 RepID=UPI003604702F